jgi:hypothetical protein
VIVTELVVKLLADEPELQFFEAEVVELLGVFLQQDRL